MIVLRYFYPIKETKYWNKLLIISKCNQASLNSTQRPFKICKHMHMHTNWAWTWSSLWPAATEICLFNHQIKFMASFFHHTDAPPLSRGGIRSSIISVGARSVLALSPSPCRTPWAPAAISFSLHANPSGLVSFPPPLLFSSHLISSPSFQSFRSSFKPGPRGQEFGLVFQTSLLALLW